MKPGCTFVQYVRKENVALNVLSAGSMSECVYVFVFWGGIQLLVVALLVSKSDFKTS